MNTTNLSVLVPNIYNFTSSYQCWISILTHKTLPTYTTNLQQTTISNVAAFSKMTNKAGYFTRIVCWQTILMKYHTLFFSKIRKDVAKFWFATVVIGALRVKSESPIYLQTKQLSQDMSFQQCSMCHQQSLRPACAYGQPDQPLLVA